MIIHVPRVLWTVARGLLNPQPARTTHVYRARVNALLDVDQFLHMNNASYAVHFEMARWEMAASNGLLRATARENIAFIVASSAMRFRRELKPMQTFEIHTEVLSAGDKDMYFMHTARSGDKVCAGAVLRAVLRRGREKVSPRDMMLRVGAKAEDLPVPDDGTAATLAALATLEEALAQ